MKHLIAISGISLLAIATSLAQSYETGGRATGRGARCSREWKTRRLRNRGPALVRPLGLDPRPAAL